MSGGKGALLEPMKKRDTEWYNKEINVTELIPHVDALDKERIEMQWMKRGLSDAMKRLMLQK